MSLRHPSARCSLSAARRLTRRSTRRRRTGQTSIRAFAKLANPLRASPPTPPPVPASQNAACSATRREGAMLPARPGAGLGKAVGRVPASPTTTPKTICRSRAGQYAIARHPRAGHAPVGCHARMRPHAGFPDQRTFHAEKTWMNRHFANKPHLVHELAPLYPKNRRKPQGTASGLRFFRAANSTIYLQFSQALPQNRRNRRNRKGCQSPETA